MTSHTTSRSDARGDSLAARMLPVVERYEAALRRGEPCAMEDFLSGWNEPERACLREVLLRVRDQCSRASTLHGEETHRSNQPPNEGFPDGQAAEDAASRAPAEVAAQASGVPSRSTSAEPRSLTQLGRFKLLRAMGKGGFGFVFEAEDPDEQTHVALKVLKRKDPDYLARFKNEFRTLKELTHPNLVKMHELDVTGDRPFFTMELIDGVDFLQYVRSGFDSGRAGPGVAFDEQRLRNALLQLARGIQFLHDRDKLHRDIKPENVMVSRADDRVVLLDFGLSVDLPQGAVYQTLVTAGTEGYMAPEQIDGRPSRESDWYSFGALLFKTLVDCTPDVWKKRTGLSAAEAVNPADGNPAAPRDLGQMCAELLRPDPRQRPAGPDILRRLHAPEPEKPEPERPLEQTWVGRERELELLFKAAEHVRRGQPLTVFIQGESAVGKTSLVRRFLSVLARRRRPLVLEDRLIPGESVGFNAFDKVVEKLVDDLRKLPDDRAAKVLPVELADLCRVFPAFERIGVVERLRRNRAPRADAQESRHRAFAALREILRRIVHFEDELVIVFIDDLQRCDQDSAELFEDLVRLPDAPPILILAVYRRDDLSANPYLQRIRKVDQPERHRKEFVEQREIALPCLSLEEVRQWTGRYGVEQSAPEIHAQSRGLPLHVEYLMRSVRGTPLEAQRGAPVRLVQGAEPLSLSRVLWRDISPMSEPHRRFLAVVAIAGRPVSRQIAGRAAQVGDTASLAAELRDRQFVRISRAPDGKEVLEPHHDRVRETVLEHMAREDRRALSEALARVLEERGGADAEWLAELYAAGGQCLEAGQYSRVAADDAKRKLAFANAAQLYRKALDWLPCQGEEEARLRECLADSLSHSGRTKEAAQEYLRAADISHAQQATDLRCRAALRYLTSGHIEDGLHTLRGVLRAAGLSYPATRTRALIALLTERLRLSLRGRQVRRPRATGLDAASQTRLNVTWSAAAGLSVVAPLHAASFVTRNLRLALDAAAPHELARALAAQISHLSIGGRSGRKSVCRFMRTLRTVTANFHRQAQTGPWRESSRSRQDQHPYGRAAREMARGTSALLQGRWKQAQRSCDRAALYLQDPECRDVTWELDTARTFALWALMSMGQIDELTRRQPDLLRSAQENDDLFAVLNFGSLVMTHVLLGADNPDEARRRLDEERLRLTQFGFFVQHHNWWQARTFLELYDGNPRAAWEVIAEGGKGNRASLIGYVQQARINFLEKHGRAAIASAAAVDDPQPYLKRAEQTIRRLQREHSPWATAFAKMLQGGAAFVRGQRGAAIEWLERAAVDFDRVHMRLFAQSARRQVGLLLGGQKGEALCRQADVEMRKLGVQSPVRMADAMCPGFVLRPGPGTST